LSQVIKKRRIVLASVLKPVDDTRMFEKLGATLAEDKSFEVSIIGYPSTNPSIQANITLIPLPAFNRISFKRLIQPWIVFKKINKIDPEIIIINTPELLFVAVLSRIFFKRRIIYDVLENYYLNIRFTATYPWLARPILSCIIRVVEWITAPFVHHFLLAEKAYSKELGFAKPFTILQNKLPKSLALKYPRKQTDGNSKLIFTGTLATSTGIFDAIKLYKRLREIAATYSLTIIGYCPIPETLSEIKHEIKDDPSIRLIGGDLLVPHDQILDQISRTDFGIIIYPPNPSTQSSIPTKLYEYLALQVPVLIHHNEESHQLVESNHAGMIINEPLNFIQLSTEIKKQRSPRPVSEHIFWESEAKNLIASLNLK
jgi:glycosyltransferase involved in cell wall biosynthesis